MMHTRLDFLKNGNTPEPLLELAEKILANERISAEECELLYDQGSLGYLGMLANELKTQRHGNVVYFNRNFHIEPTNICVFDCKFCSYSRLLKHREEGWEFSEEQILDIVRSYQNKPVTEVHIVGGVHPKMGLRYFAELIKKVKEIIPSIHVKAFTAVELEYMCRKAGVNYEEGLKILKDHGQDSLPGGGAEIFDESIRNEICADKCTAAQWLEVHRTAHKIGMPSNATMLYGHIESYAHRIDHMERLRKLQDETGGFNTFIPLKFRNKGNQMSHIAEVSVIEDLRNYAIARIYLDNFAHIKTYWPMIGRSTAQLSLSYGVDDLDGTIDDTTKIYSMAGSEEHSPSLTTEEIIALISETGRVAVERDTVYNVIRNYNVHPLEAETTPNP
jgi:aminodeoxyfutalosine synthase